MLAVGLAFTVTGCGSSNVTYDANAVRDCLPGFQDDTQDALAADAPGGAFEATIGRNTVTLAFGRSEGDAERLMGSYRTLGEAFDQPVDDILSRRGNLVMVWANTPSSVERDTLEKCL